MIVYRVAHKDYINDLEGTGARLFGGRWNCINTPCIYTSEHISLAVLEKLVHAKVPENMQQIALLKIELPKDDRLFHINAEKLNASWTQDVNYTQWLGGQLLEDSSILAFTVPSVIIPEERNIIINPLSTHIKQVKFKEIKDFTADYRLLGKLFNDNP